MIRVALAGNPNCGKTTLFNSLTGASAHVGNWPGVTVEKRSGRYRKAGEPVEIIDLPGIYSLSPYTPEEVISRNYILDEKPDAVIDVVDATNLERNLYLTTQLLEMDVPIIVALNLIDVVNKSGDLIDVKRLSDKLGVPVVPISALRDKDFNALMKTTLKEAGRKREGVSVLFDDSLLSHLIKDVEAAFKARKVDNSLFHAIKLIESDELETSMHEDLVSLLATLRSRIKDETLGQDLEAIVADRRYKYIAGHYSPAYKKKAAPALSRSDRIDRVLTNRYAGIAVFLLILLVIFHLTFSENLFFLGGLIHFPSFPGTDFEGLFFSEKGINSPGVFFQRLVIAVSDSLRGALERGLFSAGASDWSVGLLSDGVLAGIFAVFSFVPQILLLFLFFSILEDTGYMARIAFILDKIFRNFGLSGRAFLPMIMGFGCSVPAIMSTRTLGNDEEKTATIRLIPFFSCGAKLPLLVAMSGALGNYFKIDYADMITLGMYVLGIVTAIGTALLMRHTIMRGKTPPFIMELPAYHAPQFKSLMLHMWDKLKGYIEKAFTIILLSTIAIWIVLHFSFSWSYVDYLDETAFDQSIIAGFGKMVSPLFTPLGFGSQLASVGWIFVVAAVTGLIAKENIVATFAIFAAVLTTGAADEISVLIELTGIGIPGLLAFMAFNLLTIPCIAAVATAKAELPKGRFWTTLVFWLLTSYVVSAAIYTIGSWWWTLFIWLACILVAIGAIALYNKVHPVREAG